MKKIFTLITAFILIAAASQTITAATSGSMHPTLSPNPAHDYIKVNWQQSQCDNVIITLYYSNGMAARTLTNRQYCDGVYSEMYKLAGIIRGNYFVKITIGTQMWSYKLVVY